MENKKREHWEELAEQISKEQETEKLLQLTQELDKTLAEKDAKNRGQQSSAA